jgi:serum/glucocorticoid-regulated kinase 2
MSPEMLDMNGYGFSSDFYSLGAMLYEFVTGLPPFYTQDHE